MNKLFILLSIALVALSSQAQTLLIYKSDIANIANNGIKSGFKHLVEIEKGKGFTYTTVDTSQTQKDNVKIELFSKDKIRESILSKDNVKYINEWQKKQVFGFKIMENEKLANAENIKKYGNIIVYTNDKKVINGFDCSRAALYNTDGITDVWYTNDFAYNYMLNNLLQNIKGTIVLAEKRENKAILLELVKKSDFSYSEPVFSEKNLKKIQF